MERGGSPSRAKRDPRIPTLPEEIWDMVTGYAGHAAQKELRLSCCTLSRIATAHLFSSIHLRMTKDSIERMINIAFHPDLHNRVKRLVLVSYERLFRFAGRREWSRHITNLHMREAFEMLVRL